VTTPVTGPVSTPVTAPVSMPVSRRVWVEQIMGMPISIHLRGAERPVVHEAETAVAQAFSHLRRVDRVFSTWRDDSDLMRIRHGELDEADGHPWIREVRDLCGQAEARTRGLFRASLPGPDGATAHDPTGLVKGWAVEGAARHLALLPEVAFCINAGGDIVAGAGRSAGELRPWRIGIEDPRDRSRIVATVDLTVGGVATSGSAARGAHIVDPRTCASIMRDGSATVTGPSLLWADVWATALFVDPDEGRAALEAADPAYRCLVL
jgi:thiamine biosynthesis lipoprotein